MPEERERLLITKRQFSRQNQLGVTVVAITAYDAAYPRAEEMESMCDEYMVKPFDLDRLETVLGRVLH